ncbi:MAG: hypothetical protein P8J14_09845, partial [Emcibacteraceae bacterium]|nr:hypothetical protein [Emcibacteraceae bacterium]
MLLKKIRRPKTDDQVSDAVFSTDQSDKFKNVFEGLPQNIILCDPQSLEIVYVNQSCIETIKPLEQYLPISVDQLVGSSIDIFEENLSQQTSQ